MDAEDILFHPLAAIAAFGSLIISTVPGFAPIWDFLGVTSGTWFPLIAVGGGTILPNIGFPDLGTQVLLAAGIIYAAVYLDRLVEKTLAYWRDS